MKQVPNWKATGLDIHFDQGFWTWPPHCKPDPDTPKASDWKTKLPLPVTSICSAFSAKKELRFLNIINWLTQGDFFTFKSYCRIIVPLLVRWWWSTGHFSYVPLVRWCWSTGPFSYYSPCLIHLNQTCIKIWKQQLTEEP